MGLHLANEREDMTVQTHCHNMSYPSRCMWSREGRARERGWEREEERKGDTHKLIIEKETCTITLCLRALPSCLTAASLTEDSG